MSELGDGEGKGGIKLLPQVGCDDSLPSEVTLADVKSGIVSQVSHTDKSVLRESSTSDMKDKGSIVLLPKVNSFWWRKFIQWCVV